MAQTPQQVQDLLNEIEAVYRRIGETNPFRNFNASAFTDVNDAIRVLEQGLTSSKKKLNDLVNDASDLVSSFRAVVSEVTSGNIALKTTTKSLTGLTSIATKLQSDQAGINTLRKKDLETLQKQLEQEKLNLQTNLNSLGVRQAELLAQRQSAVLTAAEERELLKIESAVQASLGLLEDQDSVLTDLNRKLGERLKQEQKIEEAMGLGGAAVEATSTALSKIGLGGLASKLGLDQVKEKMRQISETVTEGGTKTATLNDKMTVLRGGITEVGKNLRENLKDPLVVGSAIAGTLLKKMFDLNNQLVETGRALGYAKTEMTGLTAELNGAAIASGEFLATNVDLLKTLQQTTDQLGVQGDILGSKNVVGATVLRDQLGLSAEEAINLAANSSIAGKNVQDVADQAYNAVDAFNQQNKTALNARKILQETANVSKDLGARFAFNTSEIAKAVTEAKNLGLTLGEVSGIADNLLQFESSITAELEAELLTGKDLTLEKARQLALNNDLAGLAKELEAQNISTLEYSRMNRLQQEATAKAVGMTADQLGKTLYQQELNNLSAEQYKAIYGEQNYEAAKQVSIQQRLEKAITKVADALTPVLELLASMASNAALLYTTIALIGAVSLARTIGSLVTMGLTLAASATAAGALGSAISFGLAGAVIAAAIFGIGSAIASATSTAKNAQSVQDAISGPGKGPFTITDRFGATAITDARDGIAVSPNIRRTSGESRSAGADISPMISELKAVRDVLGKILTKEGSVRIDSTKAGTAFSMGTSKLQ